VAAQAAVFGVLVMKGAEIRHGILTLGEVVVATGRGATLDLTLAVPHVVAGAAGNGAVLAMRKRDRRKARLEDPGRALEQQFQRIAQRFFGLDGIAEFAPLAKGRDGQGQGERRNDHCGEHDLGTHPTPSLNSKSTEMEKTLPLRRQGRPPRAHALPP